MLICIKERSVSLTWLGDIWGRGCSPIPTVNGRAYAADCTHAPHMQMNAFTCHNQYMDQSSLWEHLFVTLTQFTIRLCRWLGYSTGWWVHYWTRAKCVSVCVCSVCECVCVLFSSCCVGSMGGSEVTAVSIINTAGFPKATRTGT